MKITFDVKNQIITRTDRNQVISNSGDYLEAEISFSADWTGLEKTMTFKNGDELYTIVLANDKILQENHLNLGVGTWKASIIGIAGDQKIVTNECNVSVNSSGWIGSESIPPESVWNQLLVIIQSLHTEAASTAVVRSAVQKYIEDNYDSLVKEYIIIGNVREIIEELVQDGTISDLIAPFVTQELPGVVTTQLPGVVTSQLPAVVTSQLPSVVSSQLPAVAASAAAAEVGTWLSSHIDPDTGYVIDNTLTVSLAAADAKTVGDKVTAIKSALTNIENRFYNPNVMNYSALIHDTRFVRITDGQIRPEYNYSNSVIFPVNASKTYYLQIVDGFNVRALCGNSTNEFVTYSEYDLISSTAEDDNTGIVFTVPPSGVNYVMVSYRNGNDSYVYNANNFRLYEGYALPESTNVVIKKTNMPPDTLFRTSEEVTEINDVIVRNSELDFRPYFSDGTKLRINNKIGKIYGNGILKIGSLTSGLQFALQGYDAENYSNKVYDSDWQHICPFDITINADYYYLLVIAKDDFSAFTDLSDADATIYHVVSKKSKIDNAMPIISETVRSIAHRGDIFLAPQNTAPSYIIARKRGFTIGENDVWNSSDSQYVMWHDTSLAKCGYLVDINGYEVYTDDSIFYYYDAEHEDLYTYENDNYVPSLVDVQTLTRCNGSDYAVTDLTLDVLKRIDVGVYAGNQFKGTQILTFDEWILLMKQLGMEAYIDRKLAYTTEIVTELANIVKKYGMLDKVTWLGIPEIYLITALREVDPTARVGILSFPTNENIVTYADVNVGRGFFFNGDAREMTEAAIQLGINAGYEVEVWYVSWQSATRETIFNTINTAMSYGVRGITLDHYRVDEANQSLMDDYYIY